MYKYHHVYFFRLLSRSGHVVHWSTRRSKVSSLGNQPVRCVWLEISSFFVGKNMFNVNFTTKNAGQIFD